MKRFFCILFVFFYSSIALAVPLNSLNVETLKVFSESNEWRSLLHYHKTLLGGVRSAVDGNGFFISNDGKTNPLAELEASLASIGDSNSNFHCKFPLRFERIVQNLHLDVSERSPCPDLVEWLSKLNAKSLKLVLASSFPEAPPSMFGHVFMQLSSKPLSESSGGELFDFGLNFSAIVPEDAGIEMAYKGLFGGYEGHFSISPFHQMLGEYSHVEDRDLWIYDLNFSENETTQLLKHVWEIEMNHSYLDYFFLDENCSYQLLHILEAVRPKYHLVASIHAYSLPVESIQILFDVGILGQKRYVRKAPARIVEQLLEKLNTDDRASLNSVLEGKMGSFTPTEILDLAIQKLTIKKRSVRGGGLTSTEQEILTKTLVARSLRGEPVEHSRNVLTVEEVPKDNIQQPQLAHKSVQIQVAGGEMVGKDNKRTKVAELMFKLGLHDILARGPGFGQGMNLDVLSVHVRAKKVDSGKQHVWLESIQFIDIGVLQPITLDKVSSSWRIRSNYSRESLRGDNVLNISGYTGLTHKLLNSRVVGFSLIGTDISSQLNTRYGSIGPEFTFGVASADAWDTLRTSPFSWRIEYLPSRQMTLNKNGRTYSWRQRTEFEVNWSPRENPQTEIRGRVVLQDYFEKRYEYFVGFGQYF